jgi:hypothetical protein
MAKSRREVRGMPGRGIILKIPPLRPQNSDTPESQSGGLAHHFRIEALEEKVMPQ